MDMSCQLLGVINITIYDEKYEFLIERTGKLPWIQHFRNFLQSYDKEACTKRIQWCYEKNYEKEHQNLQKVATEAIKIVTIVFCNE